MDAKRQGLSSFQEDYSNTGMTVGDSPEEYLLKDESNHSISSGLATINMEVRAPRQRLVFADPAAFR